MSELIELARGCANLYPTRSRRLSIYSRQHVFCRCKKELPDHEETPRAYLSLIVVRFRGAGTRTDAMPAALAASIPICVSSKTRQAAGWTPRRCAAIRNGSASGLLFL